MFDRDKGMKCFNCEEWGHRASECKKPKKVHNVSTSPKREDDWSIIDGQVGFKPCKILLDTGAQHSVIAEDLVPPMPTSAEKFRFNGETCNHSAVTLPEFEYESENVGFD